MAALEGRDLRLEEVAAHVVVEGALRDAHRVVELLRVALLERLVEELLRLSAERALHDGAEARLQLLLLPGGEVPVVGAAEDGAEGGEVAEEGLLAIDVLHEAPELGEAVLDRRRREQEDRRRVASEQLLHARGGQRLGGLGLLVAEAVVPLVDPREDLVGLVDDAEVERARVQERGRPAFGASSFAADEEDAVAVETALARLAVFGVDVEELEQLLLPLPEQRLWRDEQDARGALSEELRDDEPGLDGLSEPHLVGQDAAAVAAAGEGEDDGVDLVRVGVDLAGTLRSDLPTRVARGAAEHEGLRVEQALRGMEAARGVGRGVGHAGTRVRRWGIRVTARVCGAGHGMSVELGASGDPGDWSPLRAPLRENDHGNAPRSDLAAATRVPPGLGLGLVGTKRGAFGRSFPVSFASRSVTGAARARACHEDHRVTPRKRHPTGSVSLASGFAAAAALFRRRTARCRSPVG